MNLAAAFRGNPGIGFGNVVGSNTANVGLVLGLSAVVAPLTIHRTIVAREIPMMILASVATIAIAYGIGGVGFGRVEGLALLLLFGVFLYYTAADALRQRQDAFLDQIRRLDPPIPVWGWRRNGSWLPFLLVVIGVGSLFLGGELTVRGATEISRGLGIRDHVVGLTIIAVGTSLPELATSLLATHRGQSDVAVGNVVGSNIFNLLFVLGTSVSITPSPVPAGGFVDLLVMMGFSIALLPIVLTRRQVSRAQGVLLLCAYAAYMGALVLRADGTIP